MLFRPVRFCNAVIRTRGGAGQCVTKQRTAETASGHLHTAGGNTAGTDERARKRETGAYE